MGENAVQRAGEQSWSEWSKGSKERRTGGCKAVVVDAGTVSGVLELSASGRCTHYELHSKAFSHVTLEAEACAAVYIAKRVLLCSVLILEDFILQPAGRMGGFSMDRDGLSSRSIGMGVLSVLNAAKWGGLVWMQSPSQMGVITNDRLKAIGLYVPGSEHIKDVYKHAEVWRRGGGKPSF